MLTQPGSNQENSYLSTFSSLLTLSIIRQGRFQSDAFLVPGALDFAIKREVEQQFWRGQRSTAYFFLRWWGRKPLGKYSLIMIQTINSISNIANFLYKNRLYRQDNLEPFANFLQQIQKVKHMSDTQIVNQLKFKISSLESQLAQNQKVLEQYETIQSEADAKIKALNKMHAQKVKNLLNSIQILKKQKASIEGLSKQHKRSKLIQQLNKQIADQDLAIQVLRKWVYDKQGKAKGRQICDQIIVKALTKGPDRIRPLSRQELRIQIDRLKSINMSLQNKMKTGNGVKNGKRKENDEMQQESDVSSISQQSFVNSNDQVLKKLRQYQFENENLKLEVNAKLKIIQKLKMDLKETENLKTEIGICKNEMEIANKKVSTYQKLMKDSKQNTNAKIIELYEREIKVEELEMLSKENRDKLKQVQQTHNILLEQIKLEKEQLQAQIDQLKSQNQQLILQNITQKKKLDELKKIFKDMEELHTKQKEDMKAKIIAFEKQIQRIVSDNKKYNEAYKNVQTTLFQERAQWVQEKADLLQQLKKTRENKANVELINKYLQDIAILRKQNENLQQILQNGGGNQGNDQVLLSRLASLEQKIKFLESKGKVSEQQRFNQLYKQHNGLLKKYGDLLQQYQNYKLQNGPKQKKHRAKQLIEVTQKQKSQYELMSSGISRLNLSNVDSDILDNFDSSLQYEFIVNEKGEKIKMPKLTEADRQLLKLMTSDLWQFVTDDKMDRNIQKATEFISQDEQELVDFRQVRKLKNLSNPKGKKLLMYQQDIHNLNEISDGVSVTSALDKQLNKFDSDINVEIKKLPKGSSLKPMNKYKIQDASLSIEGQSSVSSVKQGQSNIGKKKRKLEEKGSRIDIRRSEKDSQRLSEFDQSSIGSKALDSDVSSLGIRNSQLAEMDSDISVDFKKKKTEKKR